jgi:hypothetical protein
MTGYFGTGFSLLIIMLVTIVLFAYTWFRSHGDMPMTHAHVDAMAGDEGED